MSNSHQHETRLFYLSSARFPTEKAHGLQITQMCEAFANRGCKVTLVAADRANSPELKKVSIWDYYGSDQNFELKKLWSFDISPKFPKPIALWGHLLYRVIFMLHLMVWLRQQPHYAILYSREVYILWLTSFLYPKRKSIYEAHGLRGRWLGQAMTRRVLRKATTVVAVTGFIANDLQALVTRDILVEHDAIRSQRFDNLPSQAEARQELGIPLEKFVAIYVGRLHTLGEDKGLDTLVAAFAHNFGRMQNWPGALLVVGGPNEKVEVLREAWQAHGLDDVAFITPGQVVATKVPLYLTASDVCVMPHPWTKFFAYYTSPLKLFEYMAVKRAILATDMPVFKEVLTDRESIFIVPPSDSQAMGDALMTLYENNELRHQLAQVAYAKSAYYTWDARAQRILATTLK